MTGGSPIGSAGITTILSPTGQNATQASGGSGTGSRERMWGGSYIPAGSEYWSWTRLAG